ncbi:Asp-tRNA(Asn)/Glu-tRNA(Gln) amidotransferase subunit GatC [Candidatus Daviesbacteria bacterium]|nr:Asp-tRNA(Asn)/Glu-tRNA(Gln) amidotransferase subunit GatC [Candidatus Daviesbacteria bacterium]
MKLTKDQVKHVIRLANLTLSSDEEEKYSKQLSQILDYMEKLNEVDPDKIGVDTLNIEPAFNVTGVSNVMREDITEAGLSQEEALSNAPNKKNGLFVTKGVFEE